MASQVRLGTNNNAKIIGVALCFDFCKIRVQGESVPINFKICDLICHIVTAHLIKIFLTFTAIVSARAWSIRNQMKLLGHTRNRHRSPNDADLDAGCVARSAMCA